MMDAVSIRASGVASEVSEEVLDGGETAGALGAASRRPWRSRKSSIAVFILARHMQDLGRRLQREEGRGASGRRSGLSTLSQYLQRMQQELRERSLMSDTGDMAVQEMMSLGQEREARAARYFEYAAQR